MASRIIVFGATGYTGRLVSEQLVARGQRPLLAARDRGRVEALAAELGGLDSAVADVSRPADLAALVEAGDVLVSTVGPFVRWRSVPAPTTSTRPVSPPSSVASSNGRERAPRPPAAACLPPSATTGCRATWPAHLLCATPAMLQVRSGSDISNAARWARTG
jgi:NAD(P)-dependent dehydrogenase (short-subunit alcohol dehydrogenase family)